MDELFQPLGWIGPHWKNFEDYLKQKERFFQEWAKNITGTPSKREKQLWQHWCRENTAFSKESQDAFKEAERIAINKMRRRKALNEAKKDQEKQTVQIVPKKTTATTLSKGQAIKETIKRGLPTWMASKLRHRRR